MEVIQLFFAYSAGLISFLSPCALPMLPSYIALYITIDSEKPYKRLSKAMIFAGFTILGFLTIFTIVRGLLSLTLGIASTSISLFTPLIGVSLIALGIITASTDMIEKLSKPSLSFPEAGGIIAFYVFGVAYGVALLGCNLPIFLIVIFQGASSGSIIAAATFFLFYGLGVSTFMIPLTLTVSIASDFLHERLIRTLPYVKKISSVVLVAAGAYMIYSSLIFHYN